MHDPALPAMTAAASPVFSNYLVHAISVHWLPNCHLCGWKQVSVLQAGAPGGYRPEFGGGGHGRGGGGGGGGEQ